MPSIALAFDILARDVNASRVFRGLGEDADRAAARTKNLGLALGAFSVVAASAMAVVAVKSINAAADFEQSMTRISTQAGASMAEVNRLSDAVLKLAPTVGIGPKALADGLYHLESAGFRGAQAMDMLKYAAQGAQIGGAGLEETTQAMIAVMASGIKGVRGAGDAMAYLNTTVGIGDMRMEKLTQALASGILPSAKSAGLSMADVSAALATITDNATPADEAATRLRMTFAMMSAPSNKAAGALASIGMGATSLAEDMRKPNGLLVALQDLRSHLEKTFPTSGGHKLSLKEIAAATKDYSTTLEQSGVKGKELKNLVDAYTTSIQHGTSAQVLQNQALEHMFGGGKTSGAVLTLYGEMGRLQSKYVALGTASTRAKTLQDAWANQQATYKQKVAEFRAGLDVLEVRLGNALLPTAKKLLDFLNNTAIPGLAALGEKFKWVRPFIDDVRSVIEGTHNSSHGLSLEGDHLAVTIGVHLRDAWRTVQPFVIGFRNVVMDVWSWISGKLVPAIISMYQSILPAFMGLVKSVTKTMRDHRDIIDAVRTGFKFLGDFITSIVLPLLGAIGKDLLEVLGPAFRLVASIIGAILIPALKFLLTIAVNVLGGIIDAAAKAFGWVPGIGKQLQDGAKAFDKFRDNVNNAFNGIQSKTVTVGVSFAAANSMIGGSAAQQASFAGKHYAMGGFTGTGGKFDPAGIVHAGEWVHPQDTVNHYGMEAMRAVQNKTARILPGYAGGGLVFDLSVPSASQINKATGGAVQSLANGLGSRLLGLMGGSGGGGAQQWAGLGAQVLQMLGQPLSFLAGLLRRINFESGGNPNAINLWDSNARAGHPSQGLMQVIPSTFAAYAGPFATLGITNPFANVYAGANYAMHRYGSVAAVDPLVRPMGYDTGGLLKPGMTGRNYGSTPERVLSARQTEAFDRLVDHLTNKGGSGSQEALVAALVAALERANVRASLSVGAVDHALGLAYQ